MNLITDFTKTETLFWQNNIACDRYLLQGIPNNYLLNY